MSTQIHKRRLPFERPPRIRAMLTLAVASELLARAPELAEGAFTSRLQLREQTQDFEGWYATILAGASAEIVTTVAAGPTVLGIVSPSQLVLAAYLGRAPFSEQLPIRRVFTLCNREVICTAAAPDNFVSAVCRAIETRKSQLGIPVTLECREWLRMQNSSVPLHSAAETFWSRS